MPMSRDVVPGRAEAVFQRQMVIRTPPVLSSLQVFKFSDKAMRVLRRAQGLYHGGSSPLFQDSDWSVQASVVWIEGTSWDWPPLIFNLLPYYPVALLV
jgi:hypothetical protein